MVGAKSLGCLECKRRKVKCDQRYPVCRNCERLRRSCSSPKSHFIRFVRPGSEEHMNTITLTPAKTHKFIYPSSTVSERLSTDLVRHLSNIDKVGYQLQWFGVFVSFLPSRIGHNKALDAAVRCLLQAHHAMLCDRDIHTEGLESYNESIALIRRDLLVQQARTTSETVCAALILSTYEVYKRQQCQSWITHAGGVAAILQSWGPERFVSDFELALFASHYGSTISSSILSGKPCFLAAPEWLAVISRCLRSFPTMDRYAMDCMTAFCTLPGLLCSMRKFEEGQESEREEEDDDERNSQSTYPPSLLTSAHEFKARVSKHALKFHIESRHPHLIQKIPLPCPPNPTKKNLTYTPGYNLHFSTPSIAFRYNFYWAITIIANTILLNLRAEDNNEEDRETLRTENQEVARNIVASLQYLDGLRPLGALWLMFVAAAAWGVCGEEGEGDIGKGDTGEGHEKEEKGGRGEGDGNRRRIEEALGGCYHTIPVEVRPLVLERTFAMLTGG